MARTAKSSALKIKQMCLGHTTQIHREKAGLDANLIGIDWDFRVGEALPRFEQGIKRIAGRCNADDYYDRDWLAERFAPLGGSVNVATRRR
jgi:hypothetical protein